MKGPTGGLAVGLTEGNANLLWSSSAVAQAPPGFSPWRDLVSALRPAYVRVLVDWAKLQPFPDVPPAWAASNDGCLRGAPPCATFAGIRDELRAIASQQRAQGGFVPVIVITGVPSWAALAPSGCERPGTPASARAIVPSALGAYRAMIRSLLAEGAAAGVELPFWSAWNEPNHPYFISPQRASCDAASPSLAPGVYAQLARTLAAELRAAGGDHRVLLGELAGYTTSGARDTSIPEFVSDLPPDVVCLGELWTVHAYARRGSAATVADPVGQLEDALDRTGACGQRARIWVTETGAGAPHAGAARQPGLEDARAGCRALAQMLERWYRDPRVDAAFQYTFRDDSAFPVGLADTDLTRLYPAYWLLRAWAGGRAPGAPAPALPAQCA